jgi:hypothetical protein
MGAVIQPTKDDGERPVPTEWRTVLREIAETVRQGDATLASRIPSVSEVDVGTAEIINWNVESYGEALMALPEESWKTSIAVWQEGFWEVLVDLWAEPMSPTDLVLHVQVVEEDAGYRFKVGLVYVP